jgi:hypothetical protein
MNFNFAAQTNPSLEKLDFEKSIVIGEAARKKHLQLIFIKLLTEPDYVRITAGRKPFIKKNNLTLNTY